MALSFFNKIKIISFESLDSTNLHAMHRLRTNVAGHGDIIVANFQTKGQGQQNTKWYGTERNNLLASFICKDIHIKVDKLTEFNMLVSLALHQTIQVFFKNEVSIKWPNDILINDKKVAGILIETNLQNEHIKNAIIGFGININEESFPEELVNATSFYLQTGHYANVQSILSVLIEKLDDYLSKLFLLDFDEVKPMFEAKLYGMGLIKYFRILNHPVQGRIEGINKSGQLGVLINDEVKYFNHKEIEYDFNRH